MLKKIIKKIIGQNRVTAVKQRIKYVRDVLYIHSNPRIKVEGHSLQYKRLSLKGKHVFFGYYDISQFDAGEKRLLVHSVNKDADAKVDKAELGYYIADSGKYVSFSSTSAWCWQQGSRLRWHPLNENIVIYNDVLDGHYVTRLYDVQAQEEKGVLCCAMYDVAPDFSYGLSLNFSRLQRLRPGYGYSTLSDRTADESAPDNDGIFYIDIQKNKETLLISLRDLAAEIDDPNADQHYINHISISPDGSKFMFFHIWTLKGDTHWKTRLCVYTFESGKVEILEDVDRVSHYDWKNNNELLVTCWDAERKQYYCIYNIEKKNKTVLANENLTHDGHPSVIGNEKYVISDTYPLAHDMQTLFEYRLLDGSYRPLIHLYSDARLYEEKRCDLHPRVSKSEKYITVDTTCENGCRQVIFIKDWRA